MEHLTLSDQQLTTLAGAHDTVAICDRQGQIRGYVSLIITEAELNDARRALSEQQPRLTTAEVVAALQAKSAS